ncbi:hypothetical protein Pla110_18230 [Polystyrenella longa]|uniref:Endonuclease/Exonuclease/phosphatase family protein n=1 Tax=Polystyrenella longa TaxID=2528007 RepID=A0A518CLJ3_9PLAN|nr:hypothetical protein [Polystyrenella longa]QDU80101.1 hypothetical protein Pla110_18230 [Polystyrenella longa]
MRYLCLICLLIWPTVASAEEYRGIFWNLESGDSDPQQLARQMTEKGKIDFWGFSEVENQRTLDILERALEKASPGIDYITKITEEGNEDRLALIYNSQRFTAVPYSGQAKVDDIGGQFFEVDEININGRIRPALGVELKSSTGAHFVLLVQHWKCCGGEGLPLREKQAIQLNAFAQRSPQLPLISGGDYNILFNRGGMRQTAFRELQDHWQYLSPRTRIGKSQHEFGSHSRGAILDGVFITHRPQDWTLRTTIMERKGLEEVNRGGEFQDNSRDSDHRPLLVVIECH